MQGNLDETKNQLVDYVVRKIEEKISGEEIKRQLYAVGWKEEEIDKIYALSLTKCGVPVPKDSDEKIFTQKSTAGEIVVNIFSFIALGFMAVTFGILCYNIIDYFFPDLSIYSYGEIKASSEVIHYAIASLIVAFPIYFFAIKFWFSRFKTDEGKMESSLTKWITYFVLLITSLIFVGDLIAVIFYFLQGGATTRFILKALIIFLISGGIFGFYFFERKRIQFKKSVSKNIFYLFGLVTFILIFISIIIGFFIAGSPSTERSRTFDQTRAYALDELANCITSYTNEFEKLPASIQSMQDLNNYSYCSNQKDPKTGEKYEYNIISDLKEENGILKGEFELCANFDLEFNEDTLNKTSTNSYYLDGVRNLSKWEQHSAGRECDKMEVMVKKNKKGDNSNY